MKNFLIIILSLFLMLVNVFVNGVKFSDYLSTCISYNVSLNGVVEDINLNSIENGEFTHIFTSINNYSYINNTYGDNIISQTFEFNKTFNLYKFFNDINFKRIKEYELGSMVIIEGYSNKFNDYIINDGQKNNIQVCIGNSIKIGYPYILESF